MIIRRVTPLLLALLALGACRRSAGQPDANYEKARGIYQKLYAAELDDAYGDPHMDDVVALLKQVDPSSADGAAAQAMLDGIQHGREEYAASRKRREQRDAVAAAPPVLPNINPDKVLAASASPDAGPPPDSYGPGATIAEINRSTGGCLVAGEPFTERVTNKTGTVYRLSGAPQCQQLLAGFVNQAVLVVDGAVYRRIDAALVPPQPQRAPAPAPDAGPAQPAPQASTPAPAGTPAPATPSAQPAAAAPADTTSPPSAAPDAGP